MTPETVLMWSAAAILAALALVALNVAVYLAAVTVRDYVDRYRIRGLSSGQLRQVRQYANELRQENINRGIRERREAEQ